MCGIIASSTVVLCWSAMLVCKRGWFFATTAWMWLRRRAASPLQLCRDCLRGGLLCSGSRNRAVPHDASPAAGKFRSVARLFARSVSSVTRVLCLTPMITSRVCFQFCASLAHQMPRQWTPPHGSISSHDGDLGFHSNELSQVFFS